MKNTCCNFENPSHKLFLNVSQHSLKLVSIFCLLNLSWFIPGFIVLVSAQGSKYIFFNTNHNNQIRDKKWQTDRKQTIDRKQTNHRQIINERVFRNALRAHFGCACFVERRKTDTKGKKLSVEHACRCVLSPLIESVKCVCVCLTCKMKIGIISYHSNICVNL